MCWPPSEPCLRDCAGGKLPGIGEILPVGEYSQVNLPGALLDNRGVLRDLLGELTIHCPSGKMGTTAALVRRREKVLARARQEKPTEHPPTRVLSLYVTCHAT